MANRYAPHRVRGRLYHGASLDSWRISDLLSSISDEWSHRAYVYVCRDIAGPLYRKQLRRNMTVTQFGLATKLDLNKNFF